MRLTAREKLIASCTDPFFVDCITNKQFATKKEVTKAKTKAKGHFWIDLNFKEYVSFSPSGKIEFFDFLFSDEEILVRGKWVRNNKLIVFQNEWKRICRRCAKLWAMGKEKQAIELYDECNENDGNLSKLKELA